MSGQTQLIRTKNVPLDATKETWQDLRGRIGKSLLILLKHVGSYY